MESRFSIAEFREWLAFRREGAFVATSPGHAPAAIEALGASLPPHAEPLLWMATSGTTAQGAGFPSRWIGHTREALMASAKSVCGWVGVQSSDRWARILPLHHMGGLSIEIRAAHLGFSVEEWKDEWNPLALARWLEQSRCSLVSMVPTQVHDLVRAKQRCPEGIRAVIVGADRLAEDLLHGALGLGWPVLPSYGMTETASMIACHRPGTDPTDPALPLLDGVRAWIDEKGSIEGRLQLDCPQLFHSELDWKGDHYQLRRRPRGHWLSEDLVRLSPDLRSITPLGRDQDFVKILGEGIRLADLDLRLSILLRGAGFDGDCAFSAVEDERAGARLVMVLTREWASALDLWNASCAPFERASEKRVVDALPRTELGKLRRRLI